MTALDDRDGQVAGNEAFAKKKAIYARFRCGITTPLAALTDWDEAAVSDRFRFYASRAIKVFAVD